MTRSLLIPAMAMALLASAASTYRPAPTIVPVVPAGAPLVLEYPSANPVVWTAPPQVSIASVFDPTHPVGFRVIVSAPAGVYVLTTQSGGYSDQIVVKME